MYGVLGGKKGGTFRAYLILQLLRARGVQGNPVTPGLRSDASFTHPASMNFEVSQGLAPSPQPSPEAPGSSVCSVWEKKKMNAKKSQRRSLPNTSDPSRRRQPSSLRLALPHGQLFPPFLCACAKAPSPIY